jgi:hypothetical protein
LIHSRPRFPQEEGVEDEAEEGMNKWILDWIAFPPLSLSICPSRWFRE